MPLSVTSIAPYFVLMAVFALLGTLLVRLPFFAISGQSLAPSRFESLDGLRGYLALTVFVHHAVARYFYEANGVWEYPHSVFYTISPQAAVACFFMVTGFLFWLKVIKASGDLDIAALFIGRAKRLMPLYLAAVLLLFTLVGFTSHWTLAVPTKELLRQATRWLSFNFLGMPDLNGIKQSWTMIAGVFWTLRYEWLFTLALPFMAWLYPTRRFIPFCLISLVYWKFRGGDIMPLFFLFGMAAAYCIQQPRLAALLQRPVATFIALGALGVLFLDFDTAYSLKPGVLLFIFFVIVVNGNDLFGLLRLKASKYLGAVSYSLYLLHGMVLYTSFSLAHHFNITLSPIYFWLLVLFAGIFTILLAGVTYRYVELPFMRQPLRTYGNAAVIPTPT